MNNECVIGIDIGGTNIRIGRTDENDQLVDFERVSSKETFKDGNISESLIEVLKNYLDKYCKNVQVKQIAIGIPATLSSDRKQIPVSYTHLTLRRIALCIYRWSPYH